MPAPTEWTIGTLKEFILALMDERNDRYAQRFAAQEEAVHAALSAADVALTKAETASERRFESVNEFRAQLTDQTREFIRRTEYMQAHETLTEQVRSLTARVDRTEGRSGGLHAGWGMLVGAVGLLGGIIAIFLALARHG